MSRTRTLTILAFFASLPAVSANPLIDIIVGLGDFVSLFSASGDNAFVGLIALALFILYLILFQIVFKAINKDNERASPRLVNAGIMVFSAVLAIFSAVNIPREVFSAIQQQYAIVGLLLIWSVPLAIIGGAVYLKQKNPNPLVSILAGIVLIVLGTNLSTFITSLEAAGADAAAWWLDVIQFVVIIVGAWWVFSPLISLIRGSDNLGAGSRAAGRLGNRIGNGVRNWRSRRSGSPSTPSPTTPPHPGSPRGHGVAYDVDSCTVRGIRVGINPSGLLVDGRTGALMVIRPGDTIRLRIRARGSATFDPASTASFVDLVDGHGRRIHHEPFLPSFDQYVRTRGGGGFLSGNEVEFNVHVPALPPSTYGIKIVLETMP